MVEGNAAEFSEECAGEALELAHREIQPILQLQHQLREQVGQAEARVHPARRDEALAAELRDWLGSRLTGRLQPRQVRAQTRRSMRCATKW